MRTLVLGSDAALGAGRKGDVQAIANLAAATGVFELDVVDDRGPGEVRIPRNWTPQMPSKWGEPANPLEGRDQGRAACVEQKAPGQARAHMEFSNVRYLLGNGRINEADAILGHLHAVTGEVVHGEERGRSIGPHCQPGRGHHRISAGGWRIAGWLVDLGKAPANAGLEDRGELVRNAVGAQRWPAAISIGTKPTFSEVTGRYERVVEAYCLSEDWLELYGHTVRVEFAGFLRPQVKFGSADELVAELKRNVQTTRRSPHGSKMWAGGRLPACKSQRFQCVTQRIDLYDVQSRHGDPLAQHRCDRGGRTPSLAASRNRYSKRGTGLTWPVSEIRLLRRWFGR